MSLYFKLKELLFPPESGYQNFVPQFRLEGRSRNAMDETSLEMRTADPLWMLGRQWQFGEFRGEDNGSPIQVVANYRKEPLPYYSFPGDNRRRALGNIPLEAGVEAIPVVPGDLRSKVRIGQKFEALIREQFSDAIAQRYIGLLRQELFLRADGPMDEKSRRYYHLMKGQVVDGGQLWRLIQDHKFPFGDFQDLDEATDKLKRWYNDLFLDTGTGSSWQAPQLLHRFEVHGEQDIDLQAPDYQSGHLDWYSFDRAGIGISPAETAQNSQAFMPVNVSFAAMPDKRLFAFEDSQLDLAGMEVEPTDLMRLMIIDFSLVSGSDWFIVPLEMELGEICWINHVEVKDVFGVSTIIENSDGQFLGDNPLNVWDNFKVRDRPVSTFDARDHFLYLVPATTFRQESRPIEELLFLRDEYANMVWAVERTLRNEMGTPESGYELHLELNGPFAREENEAYSSNNMPKFRLASPVPTNWIPYLPFHLKGSNREIELKRAVMMRNDDKNDPVDILPISWLAGEDLKAIREEAIPRAGVRVQLTRQRVRWTNGETYVWLGRKVSTGRGEGSSGLTFDQLLS
ncbi:hypothetical protein [Flavilitoribacter nigricans]|uniref:Uncharacterized protein n=1 Tax=Flavilitoribacter nigricans (strain ATCC 23147 / DSM 23189 / NBRC 102662 / NCIMB 1420 / SS-2) TaxID=1122177 RepID=A0A2D0N0F2_FLAN2|nr:hypothetical protein [Flavilitoribacter nigricans]PHN01994.1 hypothetical protein CRP01_34375 [Flavilitoribacter nigricans DSM 23189 = NBRC 102662]